MNDTVTPLDVERGNLIPKRYTGDLRVFVLVDEEGRVLAEGARFTDGRCVVARAAGEVAERFSSEEVLAREWGGRGLLLWCGEGPCAPERTPRRFVFMRNTDVSGFSGPGAAVEGVRFSHGGVVLMWLGKINSLVEWESIEMAITTHGHAGGTVIRWLDEAAPA